MTISVQIHDTRRGTVHTLGARVDPHRGTWSALLPPMPGGPHEYTLTVTDGTDSASLQHVVFGDVWMCAGQSNAALSLGHTMSRNATVDAIRRGRYANVRLARPLVDETLYKSNETHLLRPWLTAQAAVADGSAAAPTYSLFDFCASCWYFAQALTDEFAAARRPPPTLGLVCAAASGSQIEKWAPADALAAECSHTLAPNGGSAPWDSAAVLTGMTIKGWLWQQGEHNLRTNAVSGSSADGTGYGCALPALVRIWRTKWSGAPNTTAPLAPFGVVVRPARVELAISWSRAPPA